VLVVLISLVVVGISPIYVMFCEEVGGYGGIDAAVFGMVVMLQVAWSRSVGVHVSLKVLL
jgi:hypothetical protein